MKLNDTQFCRCQPFILFLHMLNDSLGVPSAKDKTGKENRPQGRQWDNTLKRGTELVIERSNALAIELDVSFPDETERETNPICSDTVEISEEISEPTVEQLAETETEEEERNRAENKIAHAKLVKSVRAVREKMGIGRSLFVRHIPKAKRGCETADFGGSYRKQPRRTFDKVQFVR